MRARKMERSEDCSKMEGYSREDKGVMISTADSMISGTYGAIEMRQRGHAILYGARS